MSRAGGGSGRDRRCVRCPGFPLASQPAHVKCPAAPASTVAKALRHYILCVLPELPAMSELLVPEVQVTAPDVELGVTASAVEEVRTLVAAISSDFDALRRNAAAARAVLEERYAAAKAEAGLPAAAVDYSSASHIVASVDESRERLASAIDAAESSKGSSFEAELVSADVALEALLDAISTASAGAADATLSDATLLDAWATTWMPRLLLAFEQSSRLPAGPETDSTLSLVPLPAAHPARLGVLVTRQVAACDVAVSGLRALIPTALPRQALSFTVQFTEAARAAPGFDAESAVAALAAALRVDAVAAAASSLGGLPPLPRRSAPLASTAEPLPWACPACAYTNSHWRRDSCERCGGPPPPPPLPHAGGGRKAAAAEAVMAPARSPQRAPSVLLPPPRCWHCSTCGLENVGTRESCEACEDDRPPLLQAGPAAAAAAGAALPVSARVTGAPAAAAIELDVPHARVTVQLARPAPSSSSSSSSSLNASSPHALVVRGVSLGLLLPGGRQLALLPGPFPAVAAAALLRPPFAVRIAGFGACASTAGEIYFASARDLCACGPDGRDTGSIPVASYGLVRPAGACAFDTWRDTVLIAGGGAALSMVVAVDAARWREGRAGIRWTCVGDLSTIAGIAPFSSRGVAVVAGRVGPLGEPTAVVVDLCLGRQVAAAPLLLGSPASVAADECSGLVFVSCTDGIQRFHWDGAALISAEGAAGLSIVKPSALAVVPAAAGRRRAHLVVARLWGSDARVYALPSLELVWTGPLTAPAGHHDVGIAVLGLGAGAQGEALLVSLVAPAVLALKWPLEGMPELP